MKKPINISHLKNYSKLLGIESIAYMPVERLKGYRLYQEEKINRSLSCYLSELYDLDTAYDPDRVLKGAKGFIVALFPYEMRDDYETNSQTVSLSAPARFYDYHTLLKKQLGALADFIQLEWDGNTHVLVDTHPFPERFIAKEAGLGIIGKNSYLLNEQFGTATYIGLVLTDLECETQDMPPIEDLCADCNRCVIACPNQALVQGRYVNDHRCISYLTQKKTLDIWDMTHMSGYLYGCDICSKACPHTQKYIKLYAKNHPQKTDITLKTLIENDESFTENMALSGHLPIDLLLQITNHTFKNTLGKTSAGWIGKKRLQRNALIGLQNTEPDYKSHCLALIKDDSREEIQIIRDYLISNN